VPANLNEVLLWSLIALVLGVVMGWLLLARRAHVSGRSSRDVEVSQLAGERDNALEARRRVQSEHDVLNREVVEQRKRVVELSAESASMTGRLERLTQVETDLASARADAKHWNDACQRAEQQATALGTRLQEQNQAAQEKLALLERVRDEFTDKFKSLANDLLEEKSKKFTEQNQTNLGTLLTPLREQLGDFRKRVDEVYDKESRERQLLKVEIDSLKNLNQRISEDAINLTRALKGESRTQGAWGELVLERLLEASGLQKGREYEAQIGLRDEDGGRPRPDVIVHLPEGRDLIIDAKVSLTAYERYCSAAEDGERGAQMAAHVASMRTHVKQLSERRYSELPGMNSLEFVLMFVPVEAAFIEASHQDDGLHEFALDRQVVIVTTSTLLATLRTVSTLWRFDDRNRNAFEIADRAGKLYDKFVGFVEDIEDARHKLDAARHALSGARNKLVSGRGNLVGSVEKLRELGARVSKALPDAMVEHAHTDELPGMDTPIPSEQSAG
jgi:DNA recombination protein RmuC